jgi:membrane protein required for colicin V production
VTIFDYGAVFVLMISGIAGLVRGATREISTVVALVVSAILAVAAIPLSEPVARHFIATAWMAKTAAVLSVFILGYIILRMIGAALTRGVRQTSLSGLDRLLGLGIGVVRAMVVLGGFVLLMNAATPPERLPGWISHAQLYPLASATGATLRTFAPQGLKVARRMAPALDDTKEDSR